MNCPVCGGKVKVIDSYPECDVVYRKRKCIECNYSFNTEERETEYKEWSRHLRSIRKEKSKARKEVV